MNFHHKIRCEYGENSLKLVRDYEKTVLKHATFKNHLRFNLRCKHKDVIPVSLRLKTSVTGKQARNIIHKAEKSLLRIRIGQTVNKIDSLDCEVKNLKVKVVKEFPCLHNDFEARVEAARA